MPRRLPIGIQTFSDIREENRLYVDKTGLVYEMTHDNSKYVFLSRPRRFGKSLLTSTLRSYFEGRKDLFEGLAIEKLETEWTKHPVFHFDMSGAKHMDEKALNNYLSYEVTRHEELFGMAATDSQEVNVRLDALVRGVVAKYGQKAVVLIDEYDAPLLDVVHEETALPRLRQIMRNFYSPLKKLDPYLRFVFLTGITKFSQLSIFSELNNIKNISMADKYAGICGITKEELVTEMRPEIEALAEEQQWTVEETIEALKKKYDGYHFSAKSPDIFNPFSLLNCFDDMDLGSYWFGSGTPTYLIEMMRKFNTLPSQLGATTTAQAREFDAPTETMTSILPLLYQSGYMTIKGYNPVTKSYTLGIPNDEVRVGLMESLIPNYIKAPNTTNTIALMAGRFYDGDIEGALDMFATFMSTIPYCDNTAYEGHWQQMLYVVLSLFGAYGEVEVHTATGRVDLVMILWGKLYLFEVKIDKTVEEALCQIDLKQYHKRYALCQLPVVKVGMNFDTAKREMTYKIIE